ncbi:MAG: hypothetical protein HFACDABA_02559 [Anaerolineales bacterium]|nr:hypothetical protein [Anaerolineales bacterium]
MLVALFFGALGGQRLTRVEAAQMAVSTITPTASATPNVGRANFVVQAPPLAPGDRDLSLDMTIPPSDQFPNLGETVTFTIKVKNESSDIATGITVKDSLPVGLTYKSDDGGGTYNPSTGIWVVGALPGGATAQLKLSAIVAQTGSIQNTAEIWTADQADPDSTPANNVPYPLEDDNRTVTINPKQSDLMVLKSVNDPNPDKGDSIQFKITVVNCGPDAADNIVVKDELPGGVDYVSDSDLGATYNPATGFWSVGTLLPNTTPGCGAPYSPGSSDFIDINTTVTTPGQKTNSAELWSSDQYDPIAYNNSASVVVTPRSADLSLTLIVDDPTLLLNDLVEFTITVTNAGPNPATNVSVKDLLSPSDYLYLSHEDLDGGIYVPATGIWTIGNMNVGETRTLKLRAQALVNGPSTNWAEVWTADQFDTDSTPGNGAITTSEDDTKGVLFADLSVTKSANPIAATVGSTVEYTITVQNSGPGHASNVSVLDQLPADVTYVSHTVTPGGGSYETNPGPNYGIWNIGLLTNGSSATLKIVATINTSGVSANWAEVKSSNQFDPDSIPGDGSTTTDDDAGATVSGLTPSKTVVITEVAWMGTRASSNDEWIELFNPGAAAVNMTGWQIRAFSAINSTPRIIPIDATTCQGTCIIDPGEYFLLERGTSDNNVSDISADVLYPTTYLGVSTQLNNSGEMLLLCTPANVALDNCKPTAPNLNANVVDFANGYNIGAGTPTPSPSTTNPWPAGNASIFGTMERRNLISNEDGNWFTHPDGNPRWGEDVGGNKINGTPKHANWAFNVTATPRATNTPTRTRTPQAIPGPVLVLNEFVARPGHDWNGDGEVNTYDEFVEVINAGQVAVNLSQYKLDDYEQDANGNEIKNGFALPGKTLQPGEIAVFYASQTGFFMSDAGDTIRLVKASNYTIVDAYTYPAQDALDKAYCRYTDGYGSWLDRCFPTPGLPNSLTSGTFPPQPDGSPSTVCLLPDNAPAEFVLAECEQGGLDIWNPAYWNSLPGEGEEFWLSELWRKWLDIFQ